MGGCDVEQVCKMHPYHDKKLGVCPSCLREKLSQIYADSNNKAHATVGPSCSSSISPSPTISSSNHVPPFTTRRHQRNVSDVMGSISFRVSVGNGLKKSRSIAFASRNLGGEVGNGKKKRGFWSKLLNLKGNKEVLMHSVNMKGSNLY